jgi:hypothetical protein
MSAKSKRLSLALAILIGVAGFALAEEGGDGFPPQIDDTVREKILDWVADTMSSRYVDADVAESMADRVRSQYAKGVYDGLDDAGAFLYAVEQDLRSVSDDKHVGLWPERIEEATVEDVDYTPSDADYVEHLRRTNYGYKKIEILPGNVGYLRIDEFAHAALGGPTTMAVMNTVGNTDALIIDLRWNGGGAGMVSTLSAYFFDRATHLNDSWERASDKTRQSWTPEFVPGPSLSEVPLFILISGQTFSAAESFTYGLKQLGRATVVGARSKGGGHPVEFVRLILDDLAVAMMVPNAKSINPITGTSWEGVGVAPDIEVVAGKALETAYGAALDRLLEENEDERFRSRIQWARPQFQASQHPVELSVEQLTEYAGTYENRMFVVGDDSALLYQSEPGSSFLLMPMGNDLFGVEGHDGVRFQFGRNGDGAIDRVTRIEVEGTNKLLRRSE